MTSHELGKANISVEQRVRDALEAAGCESAQSLSSGDVMQVVCYASDRGEHFGQVSRWMSREEFELSPTYGPVWLMYSNEPPLFARVDTEIDLPIAYRLTATHGYAREGFTHVMPISAPEQPQ